jgi:hypothetical protein
MPLCDGHVCDGQGARLKTLLKRARLINPIKNLIQGAAINRLRHAPSRVAPGG